MPAEVSTMIKSPNAAGRHRLRYTGAALALSAGLAGLLWAVMATGAEAQQYPSRPIRLLVGFAPGGPADIPGRAVATKLSEALGTPVVAENKPGAGSMLATQEALTQPRDGHTLLVCTYFDAVNTLLFRKARYKVGDIAPISLIATYDYVLAVANPVPAETVAQLIAATKAEPQRFNYGHLGPGSPANLMFKQLEKLTGMRMTAVPFKGSAPAMQEVIAGRLDLYIVPPISAVEQYNAKQIKVLAATGKERLPALPNVPTLQQVGVPLVFFAFVGICAGAGTPEPIVQRLNRAIGEIVASPDYRELMAKLGSVAVASSPQGLQDVIDAAVRDAAPVVSEFNLFLD